MVLSPLPDCSSTTATQIGFAYDFTLRPESVAKYEGSPCYVRCLSSEANRDCESARFHPSILRTSEPSQQPIANVYQDPPDQNQLRLHRRELD